ncbi:MULTISPECIES: OmpA family protein [Brucella]|uniref:OmpA family protein n=2 Tax=Brucella TaxID=234 RepID=A0A6I0DMU8_BRUAN|nr:MULTISPECIES: OmpA family protein [Brucella/Ochrobactrum group]MCR5940847.1 OmpA family protein [Ochrobactrum sp. XJ1]RNL42364.1 OmpA family protein [Ochrobactrum sp. MH181795]KAB2703431.1 OmpA family protein [Brucella lupini]KAB2727205.1 OmpA family protein [Brucella anthropi]KAB2740823.1 OmpA family protein [Brucella anthropi]
MTNQIKGCIALGLAVLCLPSVATAQNTSADNSAYIRDLVPEIRDLVSASGSTDGKARGLSGAAQEIVEKSGNITMRETEDSIVLSVTSDILFDFDSAKLTGKAKATLTDIAKILESMPDSAVRVVGHTDSKGADSYNDKLSKSRADAVTKFLVNNGVQSARLKPEGHGESEPVAPNEIKGKDNPDGRAQNRRVEFVLPKT